jgi:hypothetical protein
MSGEPALTAAKLLGLQGRTLPLYQYLHGTHAVPEAAGEALGRLDDIPQSLVGPLIDTYADHDNAIVRLGLVDLLVKHPEWAQSERGLRRMVARESDIEVFHYAATAIAASRNAEHISLLCEAAHCQTDTEKLASLEEALSLIPGDSTVEDALGSVRDKLGRD